MFSNIESNRTIWADRAMAMGLMILFFLMSLSLVMSSSFFLGLRVGNAQIIATWVIALGICFDLVNFLKIDGRGKNIGLRLLGWLFVLFVASVAIEGFFFDISFDGQNYHQEGIARIKEGWNPIQPLTTQGIHPFTHMFTQHFAKGAWYQSAAIYAVTGMIQTGKAIQLLYIVGSFFVVFAVVARTTQLPIWEVALFSFLTAFSPIWGYQYLSYYVDGQVSACMLYLIVGFVALYFGLYNSYILYALLGSAFVLLINLKFTGIVFGSVLFFGAFLVFYLAKKTQEVTELVATYGLFILVGVIVVGYGTYVTNTLNFGHPFYPIYGNNTEFGTYFDASVPQNFKELPGVASFFVSLFSESGQIETEAPSVLKIPFVFSFDELKIFVREEPRTGGFGPLFSGILVLIVGLVVFSAAKKRIANVFWIVWGVILLSVLLLPASWWARYVPQFFLLIMFIWVVVRSSETVAWVTLVSRIVLVLVLVNSALVTSVYTYNNLNKTIAIRSEMDQYKGKSVLADFGIFQAIRFRFQEAKIPYVEVSKNELYQKCNSDAKILTSSYQSAYACEAKP